MTALRPPRDGISLDAVNKGWRIFVVEDDHVIHYAGLDFQEASRYVMGSGQITVFAGGKWIGNVNYAGEWTFKTKHFHRLEAEDDA